MGKIENSLPRLKLRRGVTYEQFLSVYGELLHSRLFEQKIGVLFLKNFGKVEGHQNRGLRIRLTTDPPEVCRLPWELLYDPNRKCFLATSHKTPLSRFMKLSVSVPALTVEPPLRVLVVIPDATGLEVGTEKEIINQAFAELVKGKVVTVEFLEGRVTRDALEAALVKHRYHILHFISHGLFREERGYLQINELPDAPGGRPRHEWLPADVFADMVREHPSMKLVVLNTCQGAAVSPDQPLKGVAQQLADKDVPAVVAMQFSIHDPAALLFAKAFYLVLCAGYNRGLVDTAVSHARGRLHRDFKEGLPLSFATPVLYMRSATGVIFDLKQQESALFAPPDYVNRRNAVGKVYESNIEALEEEKKTAAPAEQARIEEDIRQNRQELGKVRREVRRWYLTLAAVFLAGFIAILAAWVGLFFPFDYFVEKTFIGVMDDFVLHKPPLDRRVRLVQFDKQGNGPLGDYEKFAWRRHHAELIRNLSGPGRAAVLVFDVFFSTAAELPQIDADLADAVGGAERAGTKVVFGRTYDDEEKDFAEIPETLGDTLQGRWGGVDVGISRCPTFLAGTLGLGCGWAGFVDGYQVAWLPPRQSPFDDREVEVTGPSLALKAVQQYYSRQRPVRAVYSAAEGKIRLAADGPGGGSLAEIPVDYNTEMIIDAAPPEQFDRRRGAYHEVLEDVKAGRNTSEFKDAIVVVGQSSDPGVEIHANVISNILNGQVYIRPMRRTAVSHLIILGMALLGVLLQTRFARWSRVGLPFLVQKVVHFEGKIPLLVVLVPSVYLVVAFFAYRHGRLLFDMNYHVFAFLLAYVLVGRLKKRWQFN